jgi:hypothetical protein
MYGCGILSTGEIILFRAERNPDSLYSYSVGDIDVCKSDFHCIRLVQSLLGDNSVIGNNQISSFELSRGQWPEVLYQKSLWNDRRSETALSIQ